MDLPLRGVAIYNPALLSKDELLTQFVARRSLLETILSELRSQDRPDHRVLLGPRGMGKTTMLRRIHFAVEDDPVLSKKWIALPFPEEQYNLSRLSDFYLNCVDALGDALVHLGRTAEAEVLDKQRDALPDGAEEEREDAAQKLLLRTADKLGRKLVLLIDNIEMVLERLADSQWKLRELLGHDGRLCVIGASAFVPEAMYQYKSAFYEFFRSHDLRSLEETEAREVLLHLARVRSAPEITRVIEEDPARVRTLLTLAGGNPRTLVQLYSVLAQSTEGDARSDLERLLDECTPIYKARFEALSVQAQQIVDAAALHWHPVTAAILASTARLDVNVVSSQITRLLKEGVLEAVQAPEGTRKAYQITERFFNIWYLMRASRRLRQRLVWLVESLRLVYGRELLAHAQRRLSAAIPEEHGHRARESEYRMALAQAVEDRALRRALISTAIHPWAEVDGLRDRIPELLELAPGDEPVTTIADRHRAMAEIRKRIRRARVKMKGWDAESFWELLGGSGWPVEQKLEVARQLDTASTKTIRGWMESLESVFRGLRKMVRNDRVVDALLRANRDGHLDPRWDTEDVKAAAAAVSCPELPALILCACLVRTENPRASDIQALQRAVEAVPRFAYGWRSLARALRTVGDEGAAVAAYRAAIESDPEDAVSWVHLGGLLHLRGGHTEEAESALRSAVQVDPLNPWAWDLLGDILSFSKKPDANVRQAYDRAIDLAPKEAWHWVGLGGHLHALNSNEEAEKAFRRAIVLNPKLPKAWYGLGEVLKDQGRFEEAVDAYRAAVALDPEYASVWLTLGLMLDHKLNRFQDAEQAYRPAVALKESRKLALRLLVQNRYRRGLLDAETADLARELIDANPDLANKLLLAAVLVRQRLWDEPAQLARECLTQATPDEIERGWGGILDFFASVVHHRSAFDAVRLLEDIGLAERWLPLTAALTAIRDGKRALLAFAPEVRRPAETLLAEIEKLRTSGATVPPATATPRADGKPRSPRRSARRSSRARPRATSRTGPGGSPSRSA